MALGESVKSWRREVRKDCRLWILNTSSDVGIADAIVKEEGWRALFEREFLGFLQSLPLCTEFTSIQSIEQVAQPCDASRETVTACGYQFGCRLGLRR